MQDFLRPLMIRDQRPEPSAEGIAEYERLLPESIDPAAGPARPDVDSARQRLGIASVGGNSIGNASASDGINR
jgi:hypothetical protein